MPEPSKSADALTQPDRRPAETDRKPICVDLDGTLVLTDTLIESILQLVRRRPLAIFQVVGWALRGRPVLKTRIAERTQLDPALLPYNADVLAIIREKRLGGSKAYLATGAPARVANAVASYLGCFDGVIAAEPGGANLTGRAKRDELVGRFGERGFSYIGNSGVDLPSWRAASEVIVTAPTIAVRAAILTGRLKPDRTVARRTSAAELIRAMRPFHWAKNLLIFVPLLTSHQFANAKSLLQALACFCAFNLATSSVYLVNDLFDLESDRKHPEKRSRPFAAGTLPIAAGLALAPALLGASVAVSALVGPRVSASVLIYVALVVAYSLKVKRIAMADVILLSGFYTMRVLAGGIATAIPISPWLMMLSTFLFLSLAVAKRHSELVATGAPVGQAVPGRDYCAADAPVVLALGVSSGTVAALVLALYVRSDLGATLYARPEWLYGLVPLLLFWLGRLWLISGRGQLDADPLMFTLRDRTSWALLGLAMFVAYLAGPS